MSADLPVPGYSKRRPLAVVIPAWRSWTTIDAVLDALADQLRDEDEVVVVESTADGRAAQLQTGRPWLRVLAQSERALPGQARAIGVQATTAPLIAFVDADAVPDRMWLTRMCEGLGEAEAVGGSVLNGTAHSVIGTAGYLLEFLNWTPDSNTPDSLVSCNLLVVRSAYEASGGMPLDCWPGEDTVFTYPLMRDGRATFAPHATVTHLNRTSCRAFLRHQYRLGRSFAVVCQRAAFAPAILGRRWIAPLSGLLRWFVTMRRIRWDLRRPGQTLLLAAAVTTGLVVWTAGLARGAPRDH